MPRRNRRTPATPLHPGPRGVLICHVCPATATRLVTFTLPSASLVPAGDGRRPHSRPVCDTHYPLFLDTELGAVIEADVELL